MIFIDFYGFGRLGRLERPGGAFSMIFIEFSLIFIDFLWFWEAGEAGEAGGESGGGFSLKFSLILFDFSLICIDLY